MKTIGHIATLALLMSAAPALANASDEKALQTLTARFATAWNQHDPRAMATAYTEDGVVIDPFGKGKGRAGIEKSFGVLMAGPGKKSSTTIEITDWAPIKGGHILVDLAQVVMGLVGPDGKALPPTRFSIGCVASKAGKEWGFRYCHVGMLPPPPPATAARAP